MQTVEERRAKYVEMLNDAIKIVSEADDVPQAAFIQIIFSSQQVVRMKSIEQGVNLLFIGGMMHTLATELTLEILANRTEPL